MQLPSGPSSGPACIRLASIQDTSALAALHAEALPPGWPRKVFETHIGGDRTLVLVADWGDIVCAVAAVQFASDESEVLTVAVSPGRRRCGLARTLLDRAAVLAFERGAVRMFLEVAQSNSAARSCYANSGFYCIGKRKDYYTRVDGITETAIIMRRDLDRSNVSLACTPNED